MDGMGLGLLGVIATRKEANSARPHAPVQSDGRGARGPKRRSRSVRATLSAALHRLADAVTPEPERRPTSTR